MFQINREKNEINRLEEKSFQELLIRERENLQEWIAKEPTCLGDEELLIIQKEFDEFQETKERLDLLALDKQGNLVIIENKLDDSGKDVTWQALKYASYCSSLSKDDICEIFQKYLQKNNDKRNAQEILSEFMEKEDFSEVQINQGTAQRIILIAAKFRKEVTSTVIWLQNFKLRIQCFKVTPYEMKDEVFLYFDQILPVKEAQEYTISMASKAQEEIDTQEHLKSRHHLRIEFWSKFLKKSNEKNNLFSNISPSKDSWIVIGIGMSGVGLTLVVSRDNARGEISFSRSSKEENKFCFDFLLERKDQIEKDFGGSLIWERMDDKISSRIKTSLTGVSIFEKDDWDKMIDYLIDVSERLEKTFRNPIRQISKRLREEIN